MDRGTTANVLLFILAVFVIGVTLKVGEPVPVLVSILRAYVMEVPARLLRKIRLPLWLAVTLTAIVVHNVLEPTLQGHVLNLSLLVVFLSLLFWGWLWGHFGVLLAVPMTAAVKIVLESIPMTRSLAILMERPSLGRAPRRPSR